MAAKTKTYSESEVKAMLAAAFKDGQASKRSTMPKEPGLHAIEITPSDTASNILARCVFNEAGEKPLYGTAGMNEAREVWVGITTSRGWTPGIRTTGGEAGDLSALLARVAKNGPTIEAYLLKTAGKSAKSHTFVKREKASK
jgi:hypothetical protein